MIRSVFVAAVLCLVALVDSAFAEAKRPNFLLVYTDDQRYDAVGVVQKEQGDRARFPWLQTPNIDRLASQGLRFRNAFVTNSLCSPSRASFLTGKYNHTNGVVNNHTPFPLDQPTSSGLLKQAGYVTAYFGKWHHGQQPDRPGFDHVASYLGQGSYKDCKFNVNGTMTPTAGWVDDVSTDFAIQFLKDHLKRNPDRPFDMVVGYKSVHDPRLPLEQDRELYAGESARPVPNLDSVAPYRAGTAAGRKGEQRAARRDRAGGEALLNYFRCVTSADRSLGRLLDALDQLGLTENTVVVFTSDNGYYLGEHGLGDKRSAYDESLRVPLIVRYPRLITQPRTADALALNIDLAPTLLDLAGLPVPSDMHGTSWRPVLENKSDHLRDGFFYEYFYERNFGTPTTLAVRTASAKLIKYPGYDDWTELFDLASDPYEMKDLWSDPGAKHLRQQIEAEFDRQAKAVNFHIPAHADKVSDPSNPGRF